jgi:catechol 2,3-dioxygenase-like lactoylglutathione lyase family enzyme
MLKMTGIDHVVLHVRDLAMAKRFYLDVLGMTVEHETSWQCFMHCGRQGVALFEVKDRALLPGYDLNHLALVAEEGTYESVKAELERNGAKVGGRQGDPTCIYFNDPDAHRIQILYPGFTAITGRPAAQEASARTGG